MSAKLAAGDLVALLRERGIIGAGAPVPASVVDRPWFISLVVGVAGWFAGLFLLLFVGLLFKPDSPGDFAVIGLVLIGAALGLYYADRNAVFLDQLALALSIAGQLAIAWFLIDGSTVPLLVAVGILFMQLALLLLTPNKLARTFAAWFACISWLYIARLLLIDGRYDELFFEYGRGADGASVLGALLFPAVWLIAWAPLVVSVMWLLRSESGWMAGSARGILRAALTGLLLTLSLGGALTEPLIGDLLGFEGAGRPFSWFAIWPLLSLALALFAAWSAFCLRNLGLLGLGFIGALAHVSRFYYTYGTTLLWKSLIMFAMAVFLIGAGIYLNRAAAREGNP